MSVQIQDILNEFGMPPAAMLKEGLKEAETISTIKYVFHAWKPIENRYPGGTYANAPAILPRMELIELPAEHVPVFSAEAPEAPFVSKRGVPVDQEIRYAGERAKILEEAWRQDGLVTLESLTASDDDGRVEAKIIIHALLNTEFNGDKGKDVSLEDFPNWLRDVGPRVLDYCAENGVRVNKTSLAFPEDLVEKGKRTINEMRKGALQSVAHGLQILNTTKKQLHAAEGHIADSKAIRDDLDNWLAKELYTFTFDTDVERGARMHGDLVKAIKSSSEGQADTQTALLQLVQQLLNERTEAKEKKEKKAA